MGLPNCNTRSTNLSYNHSSITYYYNEEHCVFSLDSVHRCRPRRLLFPRVFPHEQSFETPKKNPASDSGRAHYRSFVSYRSTPDACWCAGLIVTLRLWTQCICSPDSYEYPYSIHPKTIETRSKSKNISANMCFE